jgi:pyrroline-5-carboxylate reductase
VINRNKKTNIAFIGAGNMTQSLAQGLLNKKQEQWSISVSDIDQEKLDNLKNRFNIRTFSNNLSCIDNADVVILSVKPDKAETVLKEIGELLEKKRLLLISILGATSIDKLLANGNYKIPTIHCMPNVCAAINESVTSMYASDLVSQEQKALAEEIFSNLGFAFWIANDELTNSVAAISGSGPAYFFFIIEILKNIAESFGIPKDIAAIIAKQTAKGAAKMATNSDKDITDLRKMVTTPGGSTAEAIKTLENGNIRELFLTALQDALYHHNNKNK